MWYKELFEDLEKIKDESQALFMSRYMRYKFPFLGISRSKMKDIEKKYFKNSAPGIDKNFIEECFNRDEREYQYLAIDYLGIQKKFMKTDDLLYLESLIRRKSWWDSVDGFPRIVGHIVKIDEKAKRIMLKWSQDKNFWIRRVAILHQLLFKDETDTELLEKILVNNLGHDEFFINKAIGWILRDYSKTDKRWVASFIERNKIGLNNLSIREGSKYL